MDSIYQPLDATKQEIRLLRLYPRNDPRYRSQDDADAPPPTAALKTEMEQLLAEFLAAYAGDSTSVTDASQQAHLLTKLQSMQAKLERHVLSPVDGPLQGSLETVSLKDAPEFTALSYVWGSAENPKPFLLNNQLFNITQNLEDALRQLQSYDQEKLFWIDSLSINQQSYADRSDQVSRMQSIYSTAPTAAVWLGNDDPDIKFALAYIDSQSQLFLDLNKAMPRIQAADIEPLLQQPKIREFFQSESRDRLVKGLDALLNRDYWYRVWVMQEFSVSKDVYIHCGDCKLPVQLLVSATLVINSLITAATVSIGKDKNALPGYLDGSISSIFTMLNPAAAFRMFIERQAYQVSGGKGSRLLASSIMLFESGFVATQALRATDPRDKIYALLGIAEDCQSLGITVDYSQSVEAVYTDATARILKKQHFDFLQLCTYSPNTNWPSWVPDLQRDVQLTPNNVMSMRTKPFQASGELKPSNKPSWCPSDPQRISMEGVRVDTIKELGLSIMGPQDNKMIIATLVKQIVAQADAFLKSGLENNDLYRSQQQEQHALHEQEWIEDARIRLLTADQEYENLTQGAKNRATYLTKDRYARLLEVIDAFDTIIADDTLSTQEKTTKFWMLSNPHMGYFDMYLFGMQCSVGRRLFMTEHGFVGLAPPAAEVGDQVVIFVGACLPYVIRPAEDHGSFRIIGDTYVHGIMDGEFMQTDCEIETIDLT